MNTSQAVERLGRSFSNYDDLLVLSCEEDFGVCVPLLEKGWNLLLHYYISSAEAADSFRKRFKFTSILMCAGFAVYSSELLLTGIITQRLEYERSISLLLFYSS